MPFEQLKERQSVMWGSGAFEYVEDTISEMHDVLADRIPVTPGEQVLDVGAGTGGLAMRLARAGADVTGLDLSAALVETARRRAEEAGLRIRFDAGDCEQMPYEDGSFDTVVSSVGVMFSPDHRAAAGELARVTKPGGRLAVTAWRPDGGIGEMFRVTQPFAPPPPPGVGSPFDWAREEHVRELLGDDFDLKFEEIDIPLIAASGQEVWDVYSANYGPTKAVADALEPERRAEFERAFVDLYETGRDGDVIRFSRTFLVTQGRRH